jgi:hypothetical protein
MFHDDHDGGFLSPTRSSYVVLEDTPGGDIHIEESPHLNIQQSFSGKVLTQGASSLEDNDSDDEFSPLFFPEEPTELNGLNYLNVLTFVMHCFVSWGIGSWGLDGVLPTLGQIVTEYETLVTPDRWAYYMWVPILVLEAVFVISQLLPEYRSRPIVHVSHSDGVDHLFVLSAACPLFYLCGVGMAVTGKSHGETALAAN